MDDTDAALVARARAGDLPAFASLMARYRDRFGLYAFNMIGSREDAEEVLQDSFLRAYRSLADCRQPERFGAWLFRIVVNRCRTTRQRLIRERRLDGGPADELTAPGDAVAALEWREEIQRALARLGPAHREAFLLRHVEGLEYEEMARLTGANETALRMRVKRASDRLRELLRDVHVR
ncbi:MAG TPA: RNA polymerase sigma factor [Gemmatimonadales bacterium]|jgi:RNA polymerase sigma-70 factor (ECF subfamily)|nr:RNA polymerase sigma factor [Gemmatimonadales bacterium]